MRLIVVAIVIAVGFASAAHAIEGRYRIEGKAPGVSYAGEVAIRQSGEVYDIVWKTTAGPYVGTGIRTGSVISVVYRDPAGQNNPGVAALVVENDKVTGIKWGALGKRGVGTETWSFIGDK